jgi:hypothetical protein
VRKSCTINWFLALVCYLIVFICIKQSHCTMQVEVQVKGPLVPERRDRMTRKLLLATVAALTLAISPALATEPTADEIAIHRANALATLQQYEGQCGGLSIKARWLAFRLVPLSSNAQWRVAIDQILDEQRHIGTQQWCLNTKPTIKKLSIENVLTCDHDKLSQDDL